MDEHVAGAKAQKMMANVCLFIQLLLSVCTCMYMYVHIP